MRTPDATVLRNVALALAWLLAGGCRSDRPAPAAFELTERLNRAWANECVTFPLDQAGRKAVARQRALLTADGRALPYQALVDAQGRPERIAVLLDLPALGTVTARFAAAPAPAPFTDLVVEETADAVRLTNGRTGIALAKTPAAGAGPIRAVQLASGAWIGGSRLSQALPAGGYTVEVTARGPVFLEAVCRARWSADASWQLRVRLHAREPVVLLEEEFAVRGEPVRFSLLLNDGFAPDTLLYRRGKGQIGPPGAYAIAPGQVGILEPWLRWWENERQGATLALVRKDRDDLLLLGAGMAGVWVDPDIPAARRAPPRGELLLDDQGLHLDFQLKEGRRQWLLAALPAAPSLEHAADAKRIYEPPPYYAPLVKHGHFPLELVKDYVLTWPGAAGQQHPHLVYTRADVAAFRARTADVKPYTDAIPGYLRDPNPLGQFNMAGPLAAWFATQDAALGRHLVAGALQAAQGGVDELFTQPTVPYGCAPHHQQHFGVALLLADAVLSSDVITPEERAQLQAQAAFIGYSTARPEYWSPERGFAANPNMTTSARGYLATVACLLPTHPMARAWLDQGMSELRTQLRTWSDANGGWLEAPHYAMVSYDQILGAFLMARNAGLSDELFDPRFQAIARWFGQISTPPDSRFGGFRHLPPIGNTYMIEPTGEFGILAYLWRERDPAFSAEMQWLHQQHQSYPTPGIGGGYPALAGYRALLTNPELPARAPAYTSALFPETGVVLRDQYPSGRETWLHMIAGANHAHYDQDSGSITLFGKGRILADDFGYYGCAPPDDHNLVESPAAGNGGVMHVHDFSTGPRFDYVGGVSSGWTRQIAFVKGPAAEAPAYFVVRDTLAAPAPATWRLWLTAAAVRPDGMRATVEGKEDVDLDVVFVQPAGLTLSTEEKTRTSGCGIAPDGRQGPLATTQTGLIARPAARAGEFVAVLYPRLKTEKPPVVTAVAEGRGVRVETAAGVDYVFLARTPFEFRDDQVSFLGLSGCVQLRRGEEPVLALGAAGKLSAGGRTAESAEASKLPPFAPFPNGDFEGGTVAPFPVLSARDNPAATVETRLHQGNPAPGAHAGNACLAVRKLAVGTASLSASLPIFLDSRRAYRVSAKVYTAAAVQTEFGGYGSDGTGGNLTTAAGQPWQYGFHAKGPLPDWQTLETTIGPPGTGTALAWPERFLSTSLVLWLSGEPGTVYVDDIAFAPLP